MLSDFVSRDGTLAVVTPPAEIDLNTVPQLENELNMALLLGITRLIVDMSGTTLCDSAGTGALAQAYMRARAT